MAITLNTKSYVQDRIAPDVIGYSGPAQTFSRKDSLELKRVAPKPTKDFRGVARPSYKITRTVTLDNGETSEAILTIAASLPVGMAASDVTGLVADGADVLDLEEAGTNTLFTKGDITY